MHILYGDYWILKMCCHFLYGRKQTTVETYLLFATDMNVDKSMDSCLFAGQYMGIAGKTNQPFYVLDSTGKKMDHDHACFPSRIMRGSQKPLKPPDSWHFFWPVPKKNLSDTEWHWVKFGFVWKHSSHWSSSFTLPLRKMAMQREDILYWKTI